MKGVKMASNHLKLQAHVLQTWVTDEEGMSRSATKQQAERLRRRIRRQRRALSNKIPGNKTY